MITFTPLSGAARSSRTVPLAYLLQVDDVRILLDCGSPDWCPETKEEDWSEGKEVSHGWEEYCRVLRENAPSIDLVLLSHGDLAHSGLYAYAYARWGLTAPAYTTLPVQAMARVACTEDVEGVREQEAFDDDPFSSSSSETDEEHEHDTADIEGNEGSKEGDVKMEQPDGEEKSVTPSSPAVGKKEKRKYVATVQEVHEAFDSITVLRYSQPCHLQGKCQGLTIIPFNAGHTLGGTIWKIRSPTAGTILYAVDMNHMRERHLDGTVLMRQGSNATVFETLQRPDLLITDAERANVTTARRKDRDAALLDCVSATLSSRNSVLMPCDASSRVLELLVLLDQHWKYSRLRYPICLLSKTAHEMLTFVRSMMEWLGGTISKEDVGADGQDGGNKGGRGQKRKRDEDNDDEALGAFALRFPFLEIFPNPLALTQRYASGDPKLILAIPASLSHGASRAVFADFAQQENSVVLLTGRGEEGTLGRQLFEQWDNRQREEYKWDRGKIGTNVMMDGVLHLKMNSKEALQGAELEEYLAKERAKKEKQAAKKAADERRQRILEADEADTEDDESDSDSDDDDDDENEVERALGEDNMNVDGDSSPQPQSKRRDTKRGGGVGGKAAWSSALEDDGIAKQMLSYDIYLKGNVSKATSFFKSVDGQTQRFRMFPYVEKKRRMDEYGELLDVEMWLRKGKALEVEGESEEMKEMKKVKAEEELKNTPHEPPSKFVTTIAEVQLACRLLFVDLEGLNDGRAVKTIVAQVNPRKMIVVHAPAAATDHLLESCAGIRAMTKDIYAPAQGECIQIGQHTNSFSVSLSDELLASLKMSRFEDNEVGHVTGRIASIATSTIPILEPITSASLKASSSASSPSLQKRGKMLGARPTLSLPQSTLIGELKLTALKTRLAAVGVQAELIGEGVLICGAAAKGRRGAAPETLEDSVAVKKTARGKVELEGPVSDVYYVVRREVYGLHAVVEA